MIKNSKKPILGVIAGIITYILAKYAISVDPDVATGIAGIIFAIVVRTVGPIFGLDVSTPEVNDRGEVVVDLQGGNVTKHVADVHEVKKR